MSLSPSQCRAARGLVELDQAELAARASVSRSVVLDFEKGRRNPTTNNMAAIRRALEEAGVQFIPENGGGAGVRLRDRSSEPTTKAKGPATDVVNDMDAAIEKNRQRKPKASK